MTGEVTLTGQVLPIGGVREKVLAAQRAGLKRVILPRENGSDLDELPDDTRKKLEFVLADEVPDVLEARSTARRAPGCVRPVRDRASRRARSLAQAEGAPQAVAGVRAGVGSSTRTGTVSWNSRRPSRMNATLSTRPLALAGVVDLVRPGAPSGDRRLSAPPDDGLRADALREPRRHVVQLDHRGVPQRRLEAAGEPELRDRHRFGPVGLSAAIVRGGRDSCQPPGASVV
jgi:hypothetical protein